MRRPFASRELLRPSLLLLLLLLLGVGDRLPQPGLLLLLPLRCLSRWSSLSGIPVLLLRPASVLCIP